jgi:hypothetical protein
VRWFLCATDSRRVAKERITVTKKIDTEFVQRTLMGLVFDLTVLTEKVDQIKAKIYAMANEHGMKTPAVG